MPLISLYPASFSSSANADPYYTSNQVLMHFDGSFIDQMGHTVTSFAGGADISNSSVKFGTHSAKFTQKGGVSIPITPIGTLDYTLECWVSVASGTTSWPIFDTRNNGVNSTDVCLGYTGNSLIFYPDMTQQSLTLVSYYPLTIGVWYHVAVSRKAGIIRMFANGIQLGSGLANNTNLTSTRVVLGANAYLSGSNASYNLSGYMDDVRVARGVGRYDVNFAVPTAPFPNQ